jgi:Bacterial Ig domain/Calx-beta domain
MTYQTRPSNRRNLRTFAATLLTYILLTSQLAPMAMALNRSAGRKAPGRTVTEQTPASDGSSAGAFAPVPAPLRVTAAGMAPIIGATKVDSFPDPDMDGKVSPGQTITYSVILTNTGPDPALNLTLNDTVDANTTLIPGSAVATPIAFNDAYNVIGNVRIQPNAAQGLLANDINPNTGNNTGLTASGGTTSTAGGNVAINADGSFSYNPPVGFTGTDTFTYTATSANGTDVRTVTLTVAGMIFFVDDNATPGGDGRLTNPFSCLVGAGCFSASTADEPGDNIFLFNGAYIGGLTFLANQKLIGQGATDTLANISGVGAVQPYSDPLPVTNGTPSAVTITTAIAATNALTVSAGGITLRGFTVGNTTGAKILGSAFGTLTAGNNTSPDLVLNGTGQALSLTTGTFAATSAFLSVATTSSATQGISLAGVAGTASFGSTTVSGSTTQGILVGTTSANINFGNTSVSGGTDGVSLQNNASGTRTFGTLSVSNNSGIGFLHAVGGGNVNVTGATLIPAAAQTAPVGTGIDIQSLATGTTVTFAATTVNKGNAGTGVNLGGAATGNVGNVTFNSLAITASNGSGLVGTGNTGTTTVTTNAGNIAATNGPAINITKAAAPASPIALNFGTVSSINSSTTGINLDRVSGNLTNAATSTTNPTGIGIQVQNTSAGGTMNFGDTASNTSGGTGVFLNANAGAVTFGDLDVSPDSGQRAFHATNNTGTITSTNGDIAATSNVTLEIAGLNAANRTPLAMVLNNLDSTNSSSLGVDLNFVSGNLTVNDATLATNISNPTGIGIRVQNTGAGTVNFGNSSVSASGGTGVFLTLNTGNVTFADLDITPDSGQRALQATSNTGTITSTTGTFATAGGAVAVDIAGASAASRTPLNVTLTTITVGGTPSSGLILTNTSAAAGAAGFTVTGTGTTDGSGGAIANTSGDAVVLTDAERVRLFNFNIGDAAATDVQNPDATNNIGDDGISMTRVTTGTSGNYGLALNNVKIARTNNNGINGSGGGNVGLQMINCEVFNAGDDLDDDALFFGSGFPMADQLTGTVSIAGTTIAAMMKEGFEVENCGAGILNLTIANSVFKNNDQITFGGCNTCEGSAIVILVDGSSSPFTPTANILITDTLFSEIDTTGILAHPDPGGVMNITATNCTFNNPRGAAAIEWFSGSPDSDDVETFRGAINNIQVQSLEINRTAVFLKAGAGNYDVTMTGGTVNSGIAVSGAGATGARGIEMNADSDNLEAINAKIRIDGVTVKNFGSDGIQAVTNEINAGSTYDITLVNNTVGTLAEPVGRLQATAAEGIEIVTTDSLLARYLIQNNSIYTEGGLGSGSAEALDIQAADLSNLSATVLGNTFTTPAAGASENVNIATVMFLSRPLGSTMCLDFRNNITGGGPDADYRLNELAGTTFTYEGAGTGAVTPAQVQAANPGGGGTASITGGIVNNNNTDCATPATPAAPVVPPTPPASAIAASKNGVGSVGDQDAAVNSGASSTDSITSRPFISSPRPQQPAVQVNPATTTAQVVLKPRSAPAPAPALVKPPKGGGGSGQLASPPVIVGNNLNWNVGTLPAGQSVTITFQVTVNTPPPSFTQVSNQGTVTADGGISVLTDDPDVVGANQPTVTLVTAPPDLFVRDARVAEPASGSTSMLFTLALSSPAPTGGITVNLSTANGTATGGTCVAGDDYESVTGGATTFAVGEQIKTFPVTVCSDATVEGDETLFLNVNSAPGATISDGQGLGTITANVAGATLISELRTSGPAGLGDDFVEIYNNTDTPHTVPVGGYGLFKMGADCNAVPVLVGTIPAGTVIPQRGHYLFVGSTYSLGAYAAGNATLTTDIESDANVGLFATVDPLSISTANRLDAVGFIGSAGGICDVLREGTALPLASGSTSQYSFVREFTLFSNDVPTPTDDNDNAGDFTVISTTPSTPVGSTAAPRLGAPGPENLAGPNLKKYSQVGVQLIDPMVSSTVAPNRVRDTTPDPGNNSTLGTLASRRTFTNNTGAPITRLRFRVYDITTFPSPVGTADLRVRTSTNATVTVTGVGSVTALATTLETPPLQPNSGGLNSSLAAGTVTLGTPLAAGASIHINFLFGVQQGGSFRVFVFVEAVP